MSSTCILLNGDYTFLRILDWKRSMCLVFSEKVEVLKYSDKIVRGVGKVFQVPAVIVLIKVVRSVYRGKVPFSKKNVLVRDRFTCAYCGKISRQLTLDHVTPKSKGGKTSWENCVACCKKCNGKKAARTPKEAKMHLISRPFQPTIAEFIRIRLKQSGIYDLLFELGIYN